MLTTKSIYEQILLSIESGALQPGCRLLETDLANQFGVSRTPIREAIRTLESEGLVIHKPRVGAELRLLNQQEIVELYEMRTVLEATAAEMAAKHASSSELRTLETLNIQMFEAATDPNEIAIYNRQFHICIINSARNRFLSHSYNSLSHSLILLGKTTLENEKRVQDVTDQHEKIIEALKSGSKYEASQAMREHMEASLDHRLKAVHINV